MNATHDWWHLQNALYCGLKPRAWEMFPDLVSQMEFAGAQTWDFHFGNGM